MQETFLFCFFSASAGRENRRDGNLDICGKGLVIISHYRSLQSGLLKISSHPQFFPEVFLLPTSSAMNECRHHMGTCLPGCVWVFWGSAQIPADGSDWHFFSELEETEKKKKRQWGYTAILGSSASSHPKSWMNQPQRILVSFKLHPFAWKKKSPVSKSSNMVIFACLYISQTFSFAYM